MYDLLLKRRSIRKFKDNQVEKEKIDLLIKSALLSPSSRNINPWEFIVITDKSLLIKLSCSKQHGSEFLKNSPLGIVVFADMKKSDVWIEDTSIASIILQLTAETIGLKSCWIQIRERMHDKEITSQEYIKKILKINPDFAVLSVIAIGYPDENKKPHNESELDYSKIHLNMIGSNYRQ